MQSSQIYFLQIFFSEYYKNIIKKKSKKSGVFYQHQPNQSDRKFSTVHKGYNMMDLFENCNKSIHFISYFQLFLFFNNYHPNRITIYTFTRTDTFCVTCQILIGGCVRILFLLRYSIDKRRDKNQYDVWLVQRGNFSPGRNVTIVTETANFSPLPHDILLCKPRVVN